MRCKAITAISKARSRADRCLRETLHGDYCWQHQPEATKKTAKPFGSNRLYLINTEEDTVIAGPATDPEYLLRIATEEVADGARIECLQIVAPVYTIAVESVNLKLTKA
jgi:hypothetical protein